MKYLLLLLLTLSANAANHLFTIISNPSNEAVSAYCLYRQTGTPAAWVKIAEVGGATNFITVSNVPPGWSIYGLTAKNIIGESAMSIAVSTYVPTLPSPPSPPIVNLQASIQSRELTNSMWVDLDLFNLPVWATDPKKFYQSKLTVTTNMLLNVQSANALSGPWNDLAELPLPIPPGSAFFRTELTANR